MFSLMRINRTAVTREKNTSPSQAQAKPQLRGWTAPSPSRPGGWSEGLANSGNDWRRPSLPHPGQWPWVDAARPSTPHPPAPAATCGALPLRRPGTPSGWSSWWTYTWPGEGAELLLGEIPAALNLAAPDISILPSVRQHYTHAHTRPSRPAQAARSAGCPLGEQNTGAGCRGEHPISAGLGKGVGCPSTG